MCVEYVKMWVCAKCGVCIVFVECVRLVLGVVFGVMCGVWVCVTVGCGGAVLGVRGAMCRVRVVCVVDRICMECAGCSVGVFCGFCGCRACE